MELDFIIFEMTSLRYYLPIIIEANKKNIKSNFFCNWSLKKYNSLNKRRNKNELKEISSKYNITFYNFVEISKRLNPVITMEDVGVDFLKTRNKLQKLFSINYSADFINNYQNYKNNVDHIFMISKFFANHYNCLNHKNEYLGSPKFDIDLNKDLIFEKYNLNKNEKYAVLFYPRKRDINKIDMSKIFSTLKNLNFKIIVKTRGKDPVNNFFNRGDFYFIDDSWFPHISMELIEISDIVVNFGSAVVEESVMLNTPIINFDIKPPNKACFNQLYDFDYAKVLSANSSKDLIKESILNLINNIHIDDFNQAAKNHLYLNKKNSSTQIIDFIIQSLNIR